MSEEAAFLVAIREHPDDAMPRLAFADWLEERGDPRAAYLRLVVEIASRCRQDRATDDLCARLAELARGIDKDWREAVGIRYDVVLETVVPRMWIRVLVALRALTGLGLRDAVDVVRSAPAVVRASVLREDADAFKEDLEDGYGPGRMGKLERLPKSQSCCRVAVRLAAGGSPEPPDKAAG